MIPVQVAHQGRIALVRCGQGWTGPLGPRSRRIDCMIANVVVLVKISMSAPPSTPEAQVDDGEVVDGQAAQVVLDSLPELGWPVVSQHTARCIPARADLADQGQPCRVGMQRRPDQSLATPGP